MSKRVQLDPKKAGSNRLAGLLFSILPSAMILGLLAPDIVEAQLVAAQSTVLPEAVKRTSWQPRYYKTPLLVPSDLLMDYGVDLVDVSLLLERFARSLSGDRASLDEDQYIEPTYQADDQSIVIDDPDDYVEEEIFENTLDPELKIDVSDPWPDFAQIIPYNHEDFSGAGGFTQFDDFVGESNATTTNEPIGTPVVPEPGTASLLALGMVLLATIRRRRV